MLAHNACPDIWPLVFPTVFPQCCPQVAHAILPPYLPMLCPQFVLHWGAQVGIIGGTWPGGRGTAAPANAIRLFISTVNNPTAILVGGSVKTRIENSRILVFGALGPCKLIYPGRGKIPTGGRGGGRQQRINTKLSRQGFRGWGQIL